MDNSRQKSFQKLRPPCIELSSLALKFRAQQTSIKALLRALEALHNVLQELGQQDALDEKLAEYAFFPLSNVFNESQRLSSRCLEVAVLCLHVLVSRGWRQKLQPAMGKQLVILLSLLAGGSPARPKDNHPSEELICACFECMSAVFDRLNQAEQHVFDKVEAKSIVDQVVYLLLEAIEDSPSQHVQLSAATALDTLISRIHNRVLLASLLPRTVSALTKAVRPTTQLRRTHMILVAVLKLLSNVLLAVLADEFTIHENMSQTASSEVVMRSKGITGESAILDDKWLKATASQVKLALASVVRLRNHERHDVQHALFNMCLAICEKCSNVLSESLQLMIETMVVLTNHDEFSSPGQELHALKHLILSSSEFSELMRNSLNVWINALPRLMQGNDDRMKRQALRQIATAFHILRESGQPSGLLDDALAMSLVESVSTAVDLSSARPLQTVSEATPPTQIVELREHAPTDSFGPVFLGQKGQLAELQALVSQVKGSAASEQLTKSIMARVCQSSGNPQLSALWLSLHLLGGDNLSFSMSDLIDIANEPCDTTPDLIADLYSITLPFLLDGSTISPARDWRLSALALESTVLQANLLGSSFRSELIDTLYPTLSFLGSSEPFLQSHAMTALNLLAKACEYPNTSTMLVENADYIINSIALKLNSFDISPQGPQVLLMLMRLCGARLIPYLDDLIGSIFVALDSFHGNPRLVELLFEVLNVVVDEAAKNPALVIMNGMEGPQHRKTAFQLSTFEDIVRDLRAHEQREERFEAEILKGRVDEKTGASAPNRPWTSRLDGPQQIEQHHDASNINSNGDEGPVPNHTEENNEPPLSKPHNLLLSIARSTIPHLSSPSSRVRITLLQLITRIAPILARHENTFLPLVNDLWPSILPRLFSLDNSRTANHEREDVEDPVYVNIAGADAIAAICVGAGDFMSGRIEDIFPKLEGLYSKIWAEVEQDRQRMAQHRGGSVRNLAIRKEDGALTGANLRGAVDLRIVKSPASSNVRSPSPSPAQNMISSHNKGAISSMDPPKNLCATVQHQHRTPTSQIHTSLLSLLTTILSHVHIPDQTGEAILSLVSPVMDEPGRDRLRQALEAWNADAMWVIRGQRRIVREMEDGVRDVGDWSWKGQAGNGTIVPPNMTESESERIKRMISTMDHRGLGDVLF